LFTRGDVEVVEASGARAPQVIALLRRLGDKWALAIAVRSVAALWDARQPWPLGEATWGRTRLRLPGDAPHNWVDALTGRERAATDEGLDLGTLFAELPTALLVHR
jgi:maltooligosyltrehalose synthase